MNSDTIFQCPRCTWPLERVYSKKKDRWYWFCSQPSNGTDGESCGAVFSEDSEGNPITRQASRGEPDESVKCPECSAPMRLVRGGKHGDFWSCSRREEAGCKGTLDIVNPANPHQLPPLCPADETHGRMRVRSGRNGKFFGCRKYPECSATLEMDGRARKRRAPNKPDTMSGSAGDPI